MKAFTRASLAVFICLIMTSAAFGASLKIGVVDFQRVLRESKAGKAARAEIEQKGHSMEAEIKTKGEGLENEKKKLEAEALVMTKEVKEQKARDFRMKVNDFAELQKSYAMDFKNFETQKIREIQKAVAEVVEQIAKKGKYTMIVERSRVLYYQESIDVTDEVIKMYDKQ